MSLAQMLQSSGVIDSMARELNIDQQTAKTAAGALLPAIVAGMGRSATGGNSTPDPLGGWEVLLVQCWAAAEAQAVLAEVCWTRCSAKARHRSIQAMTSWAISLAVKTSAVLLQVKWPR